MWSLRQRAIIGGLVWAAIAIAIGAVALFYFFGALTQRRFDEALLDRYTQAVSALGNSGGDLELVESFLTDPAYARAYSGRYWQINGADDATAASPSLFDALLPERTDAAAEVRFWTGAGPQSPVRGAYGLVVLDDGSEWVVNVAESLTALQEDRQSIGQSLLTTFALLGALAVAGTILQTSTVLRPLSRLRKDVAHRWDRGEDLDPTDYPEEVAPLVIDINTLLERNREIVERGRRQAADLAHALKTPSAILRNELNALGEQGAKVEEASIALDRVDAQLQRSLARIRAANSGAAAHRQTLLRHSVERIARLFRSMPDGEAKELNIRVAPDLLVPMDKQDIEEILGNVLENAFRWARTTVQIGAERERDNILIRVEDDGPGIPEADRREALRSGGRLDTSEPGTGLGLAIVADLAKAYGGELALGTSEELGGLRVEISIPSAHGLGSSG